MPVKASFHVLDIFSTGNYLFVRPQIQNFSYHFNFSRALLYFLHGYADLCLPSENTISSLKQPTCPIVPLMDIFTAIHKNFFSRDLSSFSHGLKSFHGGEKTLVLIAQI